MEVEGFERGGDTATHEPDALEVLREYGVPDDVLGKVQEGLMLKSDHTRKTQELAREREQLLQERAYLQGVAAGGAKATQKEDSPFEQFLNEMMKNSGDPEAKVVAEQLRKLNAAQRAEFQRELAAATAPQQRYMLKAEARETFDSWCSDNLVKEYGKEVMELVTPQIREHILNEMIAGNKVDPEAILLRVERDKMLDLALRAKSSKASKSTSRQLEGLTPQRTTQPFGGRGSGNPPAPKAPAKHIDDADLGRMILQQMGRTK